MFLAVYYAPTPDHAYDSVQFIENQVTFGWFVRGLHHWGASGMMIAVGLHMLQVFLYGAYKPPRELMWMVGVLLLLIVMAFAFTGYLLPWDQTAYWATQVGYQYGRFGARWWVIFSSKCCAEARRWGRSPSPGSLQCMSCFFRP